MKRFFNFLYTFIRHPRTTGSVIESSRFFVKKILEPIDFALAKRVVEFGAGTGVVTLEIIKRLAPDGRLLVFETDPNLFADLEQRCGGDPRVRLINDSAERLSYYAQQEGWNQVDVVISELPLASLPKETTERILQQLEMTIIPAGLYLQLQYSKVWLSAFKKRFSDVTILFEPRNIPPAFIFCCRIK